MEFNTFYPQLLKIKNLPLPGETSHDKMSPAFRKQLMEKEKIAKRNPKRAAVMALFYPDEIQTTRLLLILRKQYKGVHSNQVAFPGGKVEPEDKDLLETALRETEEEVGVPSQTVEVVKQLSEVYIPPSNFLVQPFVGSLQQTGSFVMQPSEVEDLVHVDLEDFMNDRNVHFETLNTAYAKNVEVPAFKLNGHTVWGATAMMMSEIKSLLEQVL